MNDAQLIQAAHAHHQAGRIAEAEKLYRQILSKNPYDLNALNLLGSLAQETGRPDVAIDFLSRAVRLRPDFAAAQNNLGNALRDKGLFDQAINAIRLAIRAEPNYAGAYNNLGVTLKYQGKFDEAMDAYRQAIRIAPEYAEAHTALGNSLRRVGRMDEAIAAHSRAIQLQPNYAEAYGNLGLVLAEQRKMDAAIMAYRHAIQLKPDFFEAYNNLASALKDKGDCDGSIAAYEKAIQLRPNSAVALSNLGNALANAGDVERAIDCYRRASQMNPGDVTIHSNLVYTMSFLPEYDAAAILQAARRWDEQLGKPARKFRKPHKNSPDPERRLKIGYVSADFCEHVVGWNLLPLIRHHDRRQFEVFCYSSTIHHADKLTEQFRFGNSWRNVVGTSDEKLAEQIRGDGIDILIDLSLHTSGNRLVTFAMEPAPVQISYLGYCATTGVDGVHYRFSDPHLDPPETDLSVYSEKTVHLPRSYWCYQPGGPTPEASALPAAKNGHITFGCMNKFQKVSQASLDLWMKILEQVPGSRLLLHAQAGKHRQRVASDRVDFAGQMNWDPYIRTYEQIDIALDPFPFNGGITTCDTLWMGIPVITLSGQTAVGRGGRSILSNVGLPELIAYDMDQYVQKAVELAKDLPRLGELRRTIRERMKTSPLMDAKRFAGDVEGAYRKVWREWCAGR